MALPAEVTALTAFHLPRALASGWSVDISAVGRHGDRRKQPSSGNATLPLKIIGSGFGRTGTKSLKLALEQLSFSPCHHMIEIRAWPGQVDFWSDIAAGKPVDWHAVFADFQAAVDWPACNYWRELATVFPDAKVIHSTRPFEQWWTSFSKTIMESMLTGTPTDDPVRLKQRAATHQIIKMNVFGGKIDDKEVAREAYDRREAEVKAAIAPARLLVFEPSDGWEKLCKFLGVAIPDTPYPFTNTTEDFRAAMQTASAGITSKQGDQRHD